MSTQPIVDEAKMTQTRKKFFEESRFDPTNQKFGLFSYTGTLAISDQPYYNKPLPPKDSDGKVITKPRNFLVNPTKRGKTPDVYFSVLEYKSDAYKGSTRVKQTNDQESKKNPWKPGGPKPEPLSLYPHEASDNFKKISKKGPDGEVILEPKNFYTSPPRIGSAVVTPGVLIGGNKFEYMSDPFNRKHEMELTEMKNNKAKMKSEVFKPADKGLRPFADNKNTYGDFPVQKRLKKSSTHNYLKHDMPFIPSNPSKKGSTIGKYPEHIPDPLSSPKRRPPSEQTPWRPTTNHRTKPSPSVTNLVVNLRSEYPTLRNYR
jgi:Domain of unknown function (DUF4586)